MKKYLFFLTAFLLIVISFMFFCSDPTNPLNQKDPDYQKPTIDIVTDNSDSTKDSINVSTDDTLKLSIKVTLLERIDSVRIDYDLKNTTDATVMINLKNLSIGNDQKVIYLKDVKKFDEPKTYLVEVYAYTINGDNCADTITIIVSGVPPQVTVQPRDTSVNETDTATFSVTAGGTKGFSYQWYHSLSATLQDSTRIIDAIQSSYKNNSVEMVDSGYYFCLIKNGFGEITSRGALLKVTPQKLDSTYPSVYFDTHSLSGSENVNAEITLRLSKPFGKDVRVPIEILSSSSAVADSDFTLTTKSITFAPNITTMNFPIIIINDNIGEPTETINLRLGTATRNARLGTADQCTYTILDDDLADTTWPEISFDTTGLSVSEGQNALINVVLKKHGDWEKAVSVNCHVLKSSTASSNDFTFTDTVITFNVNETVKKISLQTTVDTIKENDEYVNLILENPSNAIISKTQPATYNLTIKDINVCYINFKSMEQSGIEPDTTNLDDSIEVTLSCPSVNEITVKYSTVVELSTAINQGTDYLLTGESILKFAPFQQKAYIHLSITGDKLAEGDEVIAIKLSEPIGGAVLTSSVDPFKYIIRDNETASVSFGRASTIVPENCKEMRIPVTLSTTVTGNVEVDYKISGVTQGSTANFLIKNANSSTLTFEPSQLTQNIDIIIIDDSINELDESFTLKLENVRGNAVLGLLDTHKVTIVDNDIPSFTFKTTASTINEDTGTVQIPVKLSNPSITPVTIRYSVEASGTTAQKGTDYNISASDSITFANKDTIAYLSVTILKDNSDGLDKTLSFRIYPADLKSQAGAITSCVLTIKNIDPPPSVSFVKDTASIGEGDGTIEIPVTYTGKSQKPLSVNYQISATSTGCDTSDYTLNGTGIITFGTASEGKISITIKDDNIPDDGEWFEVSLYNPQNISNGTLMKERVFIRDNDHLINISSLGDSGSVAPAGASVVKRGSNLQIIATPKSHYHFIKWSADNNLTIDDPLNDTTRLLNLSSNGNVTALFAIDTYSVVVTAGENGSITPSGTVNVPYGKIKIDSLSATNGYHFSHWVTSGNILINGDLTDPTSTFYVNGNGSIKAVFSINGFSVIVKSNDTLLGTVTPSGVQDATYGGNMIITATPVVTARSHFIYWMATGGLTAANIDSVKILTTTLRSITASGTVTAVFALDTSSITISSTDTLKGTVDPNATLLKPCGDSIIIQAASKTGYHFGSWSIAEGATNIEIANTNDSQTVIRNIKGNASVVANFIINSYPICITSGANGTVLDTGTHMVNYNGTYTLQVNQPSAGYKFKNWSIAQGASNAVNIVGQYNATTTINQIHGPATLQANFELKSYTLKFIATASEGTVQPDSQTGIIHGVSTLINATATPLNSSKYSWNNRWAVTGDNATLSNGNIILTGDATIRAVFDIRRYPIVLTQPTQGGGAISSAPTNGTLVPYDSSIQLTATADPGYHFDHWIGGVADGLRSNPLAVQGRATNQFSAEFSPNSYTLKFQVDPSVGSLSKDSATGFVHGVSTSFSVTVTNIKADSCSFNGTWNVVSGTATISGNNATLSSNATIKANFTVNNYLLTITQPTQGGSITSSLATGSSYPYGSSLTLTADSLAGWHFVSWIGGNAQGSTAKSLITTIGTSNNIAAVFARDRFSVTVNQPAHGGTITLSPSPGADGRYDYQQAVTFTANLESGWRFNNWTGITGTNPQTVQIIQALTVGANLSPIAVPAHVICVKQDAPQNGGGAIGSSWVDAHHSLHDALAAAVSGDSIWVAQGTYFVSSSDASVTYKVKSGVSVYGGFVGTEAQLASRNWINNRTILSGICGTGKSDTIFVPQANAIVDGFRISDGGKYGGFVRGGCKVRNCIFSNNSSKTPSGGTALMVYSSSTEVSNCVFTGNVGTNGSAILIYTGTSGIVIANTVIANNRGPAIYNNATDAILIKSSVVNNTNPNTTPGGIYNTGTLRMESVILWGNANSSNNSTQINATQYVGYSCIQDCNIDGRGVGSKTDGLWQTTNIDISPAFENSTLPTDDRSWYNLSNNTTPPFVPGSASGCVNYSRVTIATFGNDIRGMSRSIPYEIGAYERF